MRLSQIFSLAAEELFNSHDYDVHLKISDHDGCCTTLKLLKYKGVITEDEFFSALTEFENLYKPANQSLDTYWFGKVTDDKAFQIRILAFLFAAEYYDKDKK